MSLLFTYPSHTVTFHSEEPTEPPLESDQRSRKDVVDAIRVSTDVWDALRCDAKNTSADAHADWQTICVRSAKPARQSLASGDSEVGYPTDPQLHSLICYATLHASIDCPPSLACVSPGYIQTYPHVFALTQPTLSLGLTTPIELTQLFISAISREAYELGLRDPNQIESWFCEVDAGGKRRILRQGETHTFEDGRLANGFTSDDHFTEDSRHGCSYKILMTEPVLQGIAVPGRTTFVISPPSLSSHEQTRANGQSQSDSSGSTGDEELSIDESFLARTSSTTMLSAFLPDSISNPTAAASPDATMHLVPLISTSQMSEVEGLLSDEVHVRAKDLNTIGAFSGDWVVVSAVTRSDQRQGADPRLARIFAADDVIARTASSDLLPTALASPMLSHNIRSTHSTQQVRIGPTPFLSLLPPIPTARIITLARIASPVSNDKRLQGAVVRSLRNYFAGRRILLKRNDLIGVPVWFSRSRELDEEQDLNEGTGSDGKGTGSVLQDSIFTSSAAAAHAVVFFKVTHLEHAVLDITAASDNPNHSSIDAYVAATMGELGCFVDSGVTKIIQVGTEHSQVPPNVQSYHGIETGMPKPPLPTVRQGTPPLPFEKLRQIISTCLLPSAADYDLHISVLLKGARGVGKRTVTHWVAEQLGVNLFEINCFEVIGESQVKTEGTLRARFDQATACSPGLFLLSHLEALARTSQVLESGREPPILPVLHDCLAELRKAWRESGLPVVLVATTSDADQLPVGILGCFKHDITFEAPSELERLAILRNILAVGDGKEPAMSIGPDVSLTSIATQTAALVAGDLVDLISRTKLAAMDRALKAATLPGGRSLVEDDVVSAGVQLTSSDFEAALSEARASYSESIGAPKIPNVSWDDVGGLASVKRDILDTIQLPLEHPELFADGLKKRSGILLYGPPGTGKTLLAKAVATSCSLNFFSIKGPELLNMYIGESEANVRRVFQRARDAKPCVIFFDELDSVAPKRGNHGDSGGVMDRIVSQLLAELDGMAEGTGTGADVFVIGATNRPDLLDPALLRPGRFDRMLYLGVSDSHEAQFKIIQALTRKFRLDAALDLRAVAERCPFNYTGADFYALCSDAMLKAMSRKAQDIEATIAALNEQPPPYVHPHPITPQYYLAEMASDAETDVLVSEADFLAALGELVPSVSSSEMEHYAMVQQRFAKDTINAAKAVPEAASDRKGKGRAVDAEIELTE